MVMMELLTILISHHVMRREYVTHVLVHIAIGHKTDTMMFPAMGVVKLEAMPAVAILDS